MILVKILDKFLLHWYTWVFQMLFSVLNSNDLQARQAWDFTLWKFQVLELDLSINEISCLQFIAFKFQ